MPIESAPKDGRDLWLFCPSDDPEQFVGYWSQEFDCWCYRESLVQEVVGMASPSHFQPLPEPPTGAAP